MKRHVQMDMFSYHRVEEEGEVVSLTYSRWLVVCLSHDLLVYSKGGKKRMSRRLNEEGSEASQMRNGMLDDWIAWEEMKKREKYSATRIDKIILFAFICPFLSSPLILLQLFHYRIEFRKHILIVVCSGDHALILRNDFIHDHRPFHSFHPLSLQ